MNLKKITAYLFLVVIILYGITGFGMTKYQVVEKLSLGLLTKSLSFKIHTNLFIPLIILLLAHLYLSCGLFKFFRREE